MVPKQIVPLLPLLLLMSGFANSTAQARDSVVLSDGGVEEGGTLAAEVQEPPKGAAQTTATEDSQVFCLSLKIKAVRGGSVTLPVCGNSLLDWTKERMDVKRDDRGNMIVHTYQNQRDYLRLQSVDYKNRTTFTPGPSGGNLSIANVTSIDSGSYTFYFRRLKANFSIILTVVNISSTTEPQVINTSKPNDNASGTKGPLWKTLLPVVVAVVVVVVVVVVAAGVVCRSGKTENCESLCRRTQKQEAEMHEIKELNQPN